MSPLTVRLLLELFRRNSFLSFITSFLSFHLSPFIRYLVTSFRSFQLYPFIGCFLPFGSTLTCRSLLLPFVSSRSCRYVLPFVSPLMQTVRILSLLLPFVSPLTAICSQTSGCKWLQAAVSACVLHAGGNTWQSWHLEKIGFAGKASLL